ncbi:MAG TPA: alpha-L-rhamnosidase, partial [Firmicutes bacterium]|nr:alpha-L-rhamnosidase [Bacillota bacterium]
VIGGRYTKFQGSFGEPKLIAQLHIEFADGSTMDIGSDRSWHAAPGPITFSCIYGGEDYDARLEQPGWDRPGFDDSAWQAATVTDGPGGRLVAQSAPPIRVMQIFKPKRVTEPNPGIFVYDLGQNFSGWPRLTVRGQAGAIARMTPGELLDGDGKVTQHGSGGPAYFQYTLKGRGDEVWQPRFTYYGFRYVQVEGAAPPADPPHPEQPLIFDLEGHFVHNSAETVGQFSCSNPLFNRIHEIILAAIRSNMQSVFTDCPHREKLGWLEETHLMGPSILYNHDVQSLCRKIIRDMSEAQTEEGLVPDIAPEYTVFSGAFRDAPAWGSAYVILPWYLYEWYGDQEILQTHYGGIKRYVDYLTSRAEDHIVSHGLGDWCDIGPAPYGPSQLTPIALTGTAIYYQDLTTLARIAALLRMEDDAEHYTTLARDVRRAFNERFFDPETSQYATGSQTSNAMPLLLGLVEPANAAAVLENLVQDVRAHNNHLTAGDVGHRYLVQALAEGGRSDVVFDMTAQTDPPSYGFQVEHGATTLTETWDPRLGFSQNHFMMGHVEEWFYRSLAGIDRDPRGAGFDRFLIRPQLVGDLTWVKASYLSIRGRISVEWRIDGSDLDLKVTIPPNTTATVYVPARDIDKVTESGRPAVESEGVRFLRMEAGSAVFEVGSGNYAFQSQQLREAY